MIKPGATTQGIGHVSTVRGGSAMCYGLHCTMSTNRSAFFALVVISILLLGCNPVPRSVHLLLKDKINFNKPVLEQNGYFVNNDKPNECYLSFPSIIFLKQTYSFIDYSEIPINTDSNYVQYNKYQWGKYESNGDSIRIEIYHKRTLAHMEVRGFEGYFLNDTTLCLNSYYAYLSLSGKPFKRGAVAGTCKVPMTFNFVSSNKIPVIDNWIKRKGY
jgi:hypothetical protein